MNSEEKITQETKKFIQLVISMYLSMGTETKINVELSDERTLSRVGNKEIYVSVLNQAEADKLNEMKNKIDELNAKSKEDKNEEVSKEQENVEEDPLEIWNNLFEAKAKEEARADLIKEYEENLEYKKQKEASHQNNKKKRNLRKIIKILQNKVYKLSEKTKEKAKKAKEYLQKNGKKVGCLIAALALMAGVATHEVYSNIKGYETYKEYESGEQIEQRIDDMLENEFAKSLDRPNIIVDTQKVIQEDSVDLITVTVKDPNDPNFEMNFSIGATELQNPLYITKIVNKYEKVKRINEKGNNKLTEIIDKANLGRALNSVEKEVNENDIAIKKGSITGKPNMDRVPERIVKSDSNDIER